MTDQDGTNQKLQELVQEMLGLLIAFEMELTAYHLVLKGAQDKFIRAGTPWDMESNVRAILKTPALHIEAEAEYAPFAELLLQTTLENLESALACIRRRIHRQNHSGLSDFEG